MLTKPIVVLGDFNTDLNGKEKDWPELKAFKQLKFKPKHNLKSLIRDMIDSDMKLAKQEAKIK
jgi:hypothetical protein